MVERVLSMHEAPGSIPGTSKFSTLLFALNPSPRVVCRNTSDAVSSLVLSLSYGAFYSHEKPGKQTECILG